MGRLTYRDLDAVTLDAYGTLLVLSDPVPALQTALREQGVERSRNDVQQAFDVESAYYRAHAGRAIDAPSLAELRTQCARVFSEALGATLDADAYVAALRFEPLDGVVPALEELRTRGLRLAVVANWDFGLHEWLQQLELARYFDTVVPAARKPDPDALLRALDRVGAKPARAVHVGDEHVDERAARAAGMHYLPAPLAHAVAELA